MINPDGIFPMFLLRLVASLALACVSTCALSLELRGEWQQGGVIIGKVESGMQVEYQGKRLRLSPQGEFVFGLGRDAGSKAILATIDQDGIRKRHVFTVKPRKYNIQRVTGVPQKTVEPDPAQVERAKREAQMAADARKQDLPLVFFAQPFQWPLQGRISGVYGSQRVYNGVPGSPHYGVDIARPVGALVQAPAGGKVTLVHPDMFFSGGTLIIDHGHGLSSTFIHLSEILVKKGDAISQGQPIAKVGQTGRATGPHLDWRMNWFEERVDPQLLVGPMPN
jgi:murein DD-endopeptidase MepM/ murein hydrolase activator NlpD